MLGLIATFGNNNKQLLSVKFLRQDMNSTGSYPRLSYYLVDISGFIKRTRQDISCFQKGLCHVKNALMLAGL